MIKTLTDRTYSDFIAAGKKLVVCTAGYCGICHNAINKASISPQSNNIGLIVLTDPKSIGTMMRLKIKKVPTVILYEDGRELERAAGTTALFKYLDQAWMS